MLSLTWDDGPDSGTLALASYLTSRRVSATFFVVAGWVPGLSDEPGHGKTVFDTGYETLPVLGDLVALGHRLGNHTLHHVILRETVGARVIDRELRDNQHKLDPYLTNEVRFFRVPGGGWGPFAAAIVDKDPYLSRLTGPIAWDVDRKDWEGSMHHVDAAVVASRYVASIEAAGHGIVLLHDRVDQVGSTYSLDIAKALVPQLEARGFVFAAPVLRFGPLKIRHRASDVSDGGEWVPSSIRLVDVDADRRADLCGRTASGDIACASSAQAHESVMIDDALPRTVFRSPRIVPARSVAAILRPIDDRAGGAFTGDLNGDGRADECKRTNEGITCSFGTSRGPTKSTTWLPIAKNDARFDDSAWRLGDINGDGRDDVCGLAAEGVVCALAP